MAKSKALVKAEGKLKQLVKAVKITEKRVKVLTAKDAKAEATLKKKTATKKKAAGKKKVTVKKAAGKKAVAPKKKVVAKKKAGTKKKAVKKASIFESITAMMHND